MGVGTSERLKRTVLILGGMSWWLIEPSICHDLSRSWWAGLVGKLLTMSIILLSSAASVKSSFEVLSDLKYYTGIIVFGFEQLWFPGEFNQILVYLSSLLATLLSPLSGWCRELRNSVSINHRSIKDFSAAALVLEKVKKNPQIILELKQFLISHYYTVLNLKSLLVYAVFLEVF